MLKNFLAKEKDTILIVVVGTFVFLFLHLYSSNNREKYVSSIKNGDFEFVIAEYHSVGTTGAGGAGFLRVKFEVEGKMYHANVNTEKYLYSGRRNECNGKKFWVIYLKHNPNKALVDFTYEIQNIENPKIPNKLDNFK